MESKPKGERPHSGDGASPGKIFIGGLPKDTHYNAFNKHFGKYGEITDSVIMKDRHTGQPRGFGFITYADPSAVDKVIEDAHVFNGKQVEIKRTIPKGSAQSKVFKTKKLFVGGIPTSLGEDELGSFFSKYGKVVEHQIIRDHETNRSRGFGFVIFDSEEVVDELLVNGNMIDMAGNQVEIKKAEPKKATNQPPPQFVSRSRSRSFPDEFSGYGGGYDGYDGGYGPGPGPYRTPGGLGRVGGYGSEFGGYGEFGSSALGGYRGEPSLGYNRSFGNYGGGGYGRGEGYGYGGASAGYGGGYESGPGSSYGGSGNVYGRGGYSGTSRYHPYAR